MGLFPVPALSATRDSRTACAREADWAYYSAARIADFRDIKAVLRKERVTLLRCESHGCTATLTPTFASRSTNCGTDQPYRRLGFVKRSRNSSRVALANFAGSVTTAWYSMAMGGSLRFHATRWTSGGIVGMMLRALRSLCRRTSCRMKQVLSDIARCAATGWIASR